jgi:hypothetical protein
MKDCNGTSFHINNSDRAQQIDNDKALSSLWRNSKQSKVDFIRANRAAIDAVVCNVRKNLLEKSR